MTDCLKEPGLGNIASLLDDHPTEASAPCRIDFGGTLDISSFHYPLKQLAPSTVNLALSRRTTVRLRPNADNRIRISSVGFADAAFKSLTAPYDHPLGLMFAVADYFGAQGVHIGIDSTSPPQSGLGGSSVAAVALIAAFSKLRGVLGQPEFSRDQMVMLAHAIEQGVAGVPCGMQDQLAAAYGGVNAWTWTANPGLVPFTGRALLSDDAVGRLDGHLLVAYLGVTHVSRDVNSTWVQQFIGGDNRGAWHKIIDLTQAFAEAILKWDIQAAADSMNQETAIRKAMTPHVLDDLGDQLVAAAKKVGCGARFTGAGGGGCLWAIGEDDAVASLRVEWKKLLAGRPTAGLIDCCVAPQGVL